MLSRESRPCLMEREKQNAFSVFFLSRESRFCFHERHGCDFMRGTGVSLSEREKTRAPGSVFLSSSFRPVFFVKKSLSKPINMGCSFEDLHARNLMVKTV